MSVQSDLAAFRNNAIQHMERVVRGTALGLMSAIVQRTPVDTGRLRANWQTTLNAPASSTLESFDQGRALTDAASVLAGYAAGNAVYFVNNLPYAQKIENGYSGQAPSGMVAITLQEFSEYAERSL